MPYYVSSANPDVPEEVMEFRVFNNGLDDRFFSFQVVLHHELFSNYLYNFNKMANVQCSGPSRAKRGTSQSF